MTVSIGDYCGPAKLAVLSRETGETVAARVARHAKHDPPRGLQLVLTAAAGDLCKPIPICAMSCPSCRRIRSPHPA